MAIFYSPIGTREQRQSHQIWPQGWIDAAPYAVIYRVDTPFEAYHTGADLNLNTPTWDRDAHSPVYSMGPGVVTYAKFFSSGWGNLIIVRHESHDGLPLYARYAHVEKIQCSVGQLVTWETQLAQVGRINTESPFHLHFDISRTEVLFTDPGHWPKKNRSLVLFHYVDPMKFLKDHAVESEPMPEPTGTTLYVQPVGGLRFRASPNGAILRNSIPQNTRVEGFETQQIGNILWQNVKFMLPGFSLPFYGWMGAREGSAIYLAPLPVTAPPIPVGPTPYDGKSALWLYHPTATTITALLNALPESVGAVFLKTSDGARWSGDAAGGTVIDVRSIEDVDKWVRTAAVGGIDVHAWMVLQGFDVDGEAQRIIDVANVPGVKSIILDIEPYQDFWKGPRENVAAIMSRVRAAIPAGFHIGLSIDPRPQHVAGIYADEWKPFVDSVHPQCYWVTFEQDPIEVIRSAYATWSGFGKPIIPVLQGNADPADIELAIDTAQVVYKAQGLSFWRYGVMSAEQLAAISDVADPPVPDPIDTLETTERINVRSKPSTAGVIRRVLAKGALVKVQGHYTGAGANDWGKLVDEPMESYAARDFMRTPVIVVPKRDYWVWSIPHSSVRAEADTSALIVGKAIRGEKLSIEEVAIENDTWVWGKIADGPNAGRFIALHGIGGSPKLLDTVSPPIITPPPQTAKVKLGGHIHLDKDLRKVYQFIEAYQPISVTVISDIPLIRWMVEHKYVKYPIFRQVWGPSDSQPEHVGDESDIERGRRFFYEGYDQGMNLWWWNRQCPHETILQLNNETNSWKMSYWNIGLMDSADREGYKVIIDNAGVGQYANAVVNGQLVRPLYFDEQGNPHSDIVPGTNKTLMEHVFVGWREAERRKHFVGKHEYGNEEDGQHRWPGSPVGLPYYGRRLHNFLKMMPKPWPNVIINEFGSGKTERQKDMGFESTWNGIKEYLPLVNELENVLCANLWTHGDVAGHLGFRGASVDEWTDQMIARRDELPRPA